MVDVPKKLSHKQKLVLIRLYHIDTEFKIETGKKYTMKNQDLIEDLARELDKMNSHGSRPAPGFINSTDRTIRRLEERGLITNGHPNRHTHKYPSLTDEGIEVAEELNNRRKDGRYKLSFEYDFTELEKSQIQKLKEKRDTSNYNL